MNAFFVVQTGVENGLEKLSEGKPIIFILLAFVIANYPRYDISYLKDRWTSRLYLSNVQVFLGIEKIVLRNGL